MGAITDLWKSERGIVAVLLILGCTTLVALGKLTATDWLDFSKWIAAIYIPAKTVTSAIDAYHAGKAAVARASSGFTAGPVLAPTLVHPPPAV